MFFFLLTDSSLRREIKSAKDSILLPVLPAQGHSVLRSSKDPSFISDRFLNILYPTSIYFNLLFVAWFVIDFSRQHALEVYLVTLSSILRGG